MTTPLNIKVVLSDDGEHLHVTAGPRRSLVSMTVTIDAEQAKMLYDMLGFHLNEDEGHYEEWLAKQAFPAQVDQGGEIIPFHQPQEAPE